MWAANQDSGNFQMLISSAGYTPVPYDYYYGLLDSPAPSRSAPAPAFRRLRPLHDPYGEQRSPPSPPRRTPSAQKPPSPRSSSIVKSQLPVIPLLEAQNEIEFNGKMSAGSRPRPTPTPRRPIWLQPVTPGCRPPGSSQLRRRTGAGHRPGSPAPTVPGNSTAHPRRTRSWLCASSRASSASTWSRPGLRSPQLFPATAHPGEPGRGDPGPPGSRRPHPAGRTAALAQLLGLGQRQHLRQVLGST